MTWDSAVAATSPRAWWKFDEAASGAYWVDVTGNGYNLARNSYYRDTARAVNEAHVVSQNPPLMDGSTYSMRVEPEANTSNRPDVWHRDGTWPAVNIGSVPTGQSPYPWSMSVVFRSPWPLGHRNIEGKVGYQVFPFSSACYLRNSYYGNGRDEDTAVLGIWHYLTSPQNIDSAYLAKDLYDGNSHLIHFETNYVPGPYGSQDRTEYVRVYIDNVLIIDKTATAVGGVIEDDYYVSGKVDFISYDPQGPGEYDDMVYWNRVLSSAERNAIWSNFSATEQQIVADIEAISQVEIVSSDLYYLSAISFDTGSEMTATIKREAPLSAQAFSGDSSLRLGIYERLAPEFDGGSDMNVSNFRVGLFIGNFDGAGSMGGLTGLGKMVPFETPSDMTLRFDWDINLVKADVLDPSTGRARYRVIVCDHGGTNIAELEQATLAPFNWPIGERGKFSFLIPTDDPKVEECLIPNREVQVWRGNQLLWWGPMIKARVDRNTITFQCETLDWYFTRRVMGKVPKENYLSNGRFQNGITGWGFSALPGTVDRKAPLADSSSDVTLEGGLSMMLSPTHGTTTSYYDPNTWFASGSSVLNSTGQGALTTLMNATFGTRPDITVKVWTDKAGLYSNNKALSEARADAISAYMLTKKPNAVIKAVGRGEDYDRRGISLGWGTGRSIHISYANDNGKKGHGQFARQRRTVKFDGAALGKKRVKCTFSGWFYIDTFTGPAMNKWGMVLELRHPFTRKPHKDPKYAAQEYGKVMKRSTASITRETPTATWVRAEMSVMVPADGREYVLDARIHPPRGVSYWDEMSLVYDDSFNFNHVEQAGILRALVDHAQDEEMGKSDLRIGYYINDTGIKRTRAYDFSKREPIYDALNEFNSLGDGGEWTMQFNQSDRWLVHHYPRKGRDTDVVLALGTNIATYTTDYDGEQTSTSVIIMAPGEGLDREERSTSDPTILEGLVLEKAYEATPGSSISSLRAQSLRGIARYSRNVVVPSVTTNPQSVSEMMNLAEGDRVLVDIQEPGIDVFAKYRIINRTLNPITDQFTFDLRPEDLAYTTLLGWGGTVKYLSQNQTTKTGDNNRLPVETDIDYASPTYDDSAWSTGLGGIGWVEPGSVYDTNPDFPLRTTVPDKHEVWIRKQVLCTSNMYLAFRADRFTWLYVNGYRVRDDYWKTKNLDGRGGRGVIRVPQALLNPNGVQLVAMHTQAHLQGFGGASITQAYADLNIRGIYDEGEVEA